ncbi:hypothetical protein [Sinomicrobium weinanense]|uniref:Uncharacterized protein n=1 Tax=Sinomicrobium weinanense TaxID=2842200 RepID=A0A926JV78_9FLAO|nr:hypothetical protein [Sinomicrobium weinanense]MBC9798195.1 hypothetical protein [Sinomicrobium weinanense]
MSLWKKIILQIVALLIIVGCKQKAQTNNANINNQSGIHVSTHPSDSVSEGEVFLKEFYTLFYGTDTPVTDKNLKKKYISERILKTIDSLRSGENLIMDYDPFIKGQDYNCRLTQSKTPLNSINFH